MSTRKGNNARSRPPKHQNTFTYKHNKNSKLTKKIMSLPVHGLCKRCYDIIEWRKKFRKYKPLTAPKRCCFCQEKTVRAAYHVACDPCARSRELCAKCLQNKELVTENPTSEDEEEYEDSEEEENVKVKKAPEPKRIVAVQPEDDDDDDDEEEEEDGEQGEDKGEVGDVDEDDEEEEDDDEEEEEDDEDEDEEEEEEEEEAPVQKRPQSAAGTNKKPAALASASAKKPSVKSSEKATVSTKPSSTATASSKPTVTPAMTTAENSNRYSSWLSGLSSLNISANKTKQ